MCEFACVRVYARARTRTCACVHVWMWAWICVFVFVCVCVFASVRVCVCAFVCVSLNMYVRMMYACIYTRIHIQYIHTRIRSHIYHVPLCGYVGSFVSINGFVCVHGRVYAWVSTIYIYIYIYSMRPVGRHADVCTHIWHMHPYMTYHVQHW